MSGIARILVIVIAGGLWPAAAAAQAVVGDPGNPAKTFASNCSACHKSPQGLAKSGNVAGFLRQHYTTGSAMSSAMASYLASVGNAPPAKQASPADARRRKDAPARTEAAERSDGGDRQTERIADPHRTAAKQKTPSDTRASSRSRPTGTAARPAEPAPEAPSEAAPVETPPAATAALGQPEGAPAAPAPSAVDVSAFPPPPAYPPPEAILLPEPDQPAFSSAPLP